MKGEKLPKACLILDSMLFCNFSEVFFQLLLSCISWWYPVCTDAPFHQAGDSDIKADSILRMMMSEHIFQRLLKKYFWWLFSFRFILETAPHNISVNPEHCHKASPEGTEGSL